MPNDLKHDKHMMPADSDHAWRRVRGLELEPVGGQPEISHMMTEHFEGGAATAEGAARTAFGMSHDPDRLYCDGARREAQLAYERLANGFHARVARDNRTYLVGVTVLALGLIAMLAALYFLNLGRSAPAHVAVDNAGWCSNWRSALSCPNAQGNARD